MIVALPVLLVEHTRVVKERHTVVVGELVGEAITTGHRTTVNLTDTDADTTGPITIAIGSAT